MKIDPNSIKLFKEWKESDDYLISFWFLNKEKEIKKWFENNELKGFEFDDYQWSANELYIIYNGHLEFHEETIEYRLDIVIDLKDIIDSQVTKLTIVLTSYEIEELKMINKIRKDIEDKEFNSGLLINMIAEIKETIE